MTPMEKTFEQKLARLRADPSARDFILADAKDADMAWGIASPGAPHPPRPDGRCRGMPELMQDAREITGSGLVDIMLASTSVMSVLAHRENLFAESPVTPAVRANDTTDVWISREADYRCKPSLPFRSSYLEEAQYGRLGAPDGEKPKINHGLYSITFNNDLEHDFQHLRAFREFRADAAAHNFDYFLEVFAPNVADCGLGPEQVPKFVNDALVRMLAGVSRAHWPRFLKIPYFGPAAMEELVAYDPELIVGILGGGPGTTYDAFKQLSEAKKHGARVALYGRKIKDAEHSLTFVRFLRAVADEELGAEEAVKAYHGELQKLGVPPRRPIERDMELTAPELSYASN